jgi:hypothetical protein
MAKIQLTDYTNFDRGIETISVAKDLQKLKLPEPARLVSSEKEDLQLTKLWKPTSLEAVLKASLLPTIKDRDELSPAVYQKRLRDAKQEFIKRLKEERNRKRKPRKPYEDEPEEVFEQVISDLDELESHQDLLWMLKQVVHLA